MDETSQAALRVALLAHDCERGEFRALLEDEGIEVVIDGRPDLPLPRDWRGADVLLVDMDDQPDRAQVESLLQNAPVPVLLNAGGVGSSVIWHRRLVGKLQILANRAVPHARIRAPRLRPDLQLVQAQADLGPETPWLVVLGASIGGPKAVARFLQALPVDLPVTFLLGQHISEAFQDLLVEQLDRCSRWPVAVLGDSQTIEAGQVWLVPSECRIDIDERGVRRRSEEAWQSAQRPDIDALLHSVASVFRSRCGVILFSGLGKDGSRGCQAITGNGGFVWVQSSESCVIPNMPDAARRCCEVELSGSPEELARALATRCQTAQLSIN
ncbi:MAG: chemotaxis protein CheB [Thiogranum sp.]|jgi:chemosensory pili system protein ChpB (putative protein-glutamate methylesterase)